MTVPLGAPLPVKLLEMVIVVDIKNGSRFPFFLNSEVVKTKSD
jgi:hypothetical protein